MSNELTSTNVLIMDVFTLLFQVRIVIMMCDPPGLQVNKMVCLEEMHIRSLKVRILTMRNLNMVL